MFRPRPLQCALLSLVALVPNVRAQSSGKAALDASSAVRSALTQADNGHCAEALPVLKRTVEQIHGSELKRKAALSGVRCAMTANQTDAALKFLQVLARDFPNDPDSLYVATHAFSDLSTLASQELGRNASSSYQAHELLAESFESQGKWNEAAKEYRSIVAQNPNLPGIHFRLGRMLLSTPNPSPDVATEAKAEFIQELKIDPKNAGAEYVLGELARQSHEWEEAVNHFSRATKLDPQFGEAFLGLGMSLVADKHYSDAIAPLQTAIKLDPRNPDAHYNLALAYSRSGRKEDGEREFAIHRTLIGNGDAPAGSSPSAAPPEVNKK